MQINKTNNENHIVYSLAGRLDTITSPELQDALMPSIDGSADIVLDFKELVYVSSAGLRVLLTAQKASIKHGISMNLRNVCDEIMEVFDMTGFSDVLQIEK